jgi:hypothetical protein
LDGLRKPSAIRPVTGADLSSDGTDFDTGTSANKHGSTDPESSSAPRAQLVRLPAPKALLIKLPEWRIGEQHRLLMPYGTEVVGQLNHIGDTWIVGTTPWIWLVAPGLNHANWADP